MRKNVKKNIPIFILFGFLNDFVYVVYCTKIQCKQYNTGKKYKWKNFSHLHVIVFLFSGWIFLGIFVSHMALYRLFISFFCLLAMLLHYIEDDENWNENEVLQTKACKNIFLVMTFLLTLWSSCNFFLCFCGLWYLKFTREFFLTFFSLT